MIRSYTVESYSTVLKKWFTMSEFRNKEIAIKQAGKSYNKLWGKTRIKKIESEIIWKSK